MIKRTYFVLAKCYSKESDLISSWHWFAVDFRSWLKPKFNDIANAAIDHVEVRSIYAKDNRANIVLLSISKI